MGVLGMLLALGSAVAMAATLVPAAAAAATAEPAAATTATQPATSAACPPVLRHTANRLQDEAPQNLCQYAGRVVLVVNTASYCGFTPQYEGLEKLHARYAARGLTVMGFPSNDFAQETVDRKAIAQLCFNTYGVEFPMFTPVAVRGSDAHPLFADLARASGQAPRWNFHKYLIDRSGRVVANFASSVEPLDARLTAPLEQALAQPAPR